MNEFKYLYDANLDLWYEITGVDLYNGEDARFIGYELNDEVERCLGTTTFECTKDLVKGISTNNILILE